MRDRSILEPAFEEYIIPRDFKKFPIKENSVYGVATNDADYVIQIYEKLPNGKRKPVWRCPVYTVWNNMIKRGYSRKCKESQPTYQNVSVCNDWLLFSNFMKWWVENNVKGWSLEKDILHKGNLVYAPDKCVYVPNYINNLLTDRAALRGEYPLGVCFDRHANRFRSLVRLNGKRKHLGLFTSPQQAHKVWQIAKIDCIKDAIAHYTEESANLGVFDQRIVSSLEGRIAILQDDMDNGRETFVLH